MKKFLILLMVLGMASWAHAGLIDVVVVGHTDVDGDGEISPSDFVQIAIVIADGLTSDGYDLDLHVSGVGTLQEHNGGPNVNHQAGVGMWVYSGIANNGIAQMTEVHLMGVFTGEIVGGLEIHCDGLGDVLVDLTINGGTRIDGQVITEADLGDLVIKQIPEPMTIALLGLGSLFMIRRRK